MINRKTKKYKPWQIERRSFREVRGRLGRVVDRALAHGPQIITRRGIGVAAIIPLEELPKVISSDGKPSIVATLLCIPCVIPGFGERGNRRGESAVSKL